MSYRNLLIVGLIVVVGLCLFELHNLVAAKKEETETQRRMQFEQRSSETKTDIEYRRALLKERWQTERMQILQNVEIMAKQGWKEEKTVAQIGQWLKNLDGHYQSAETDLLFEEVYKIAELRKQIWNQENP